MECILIVFWRVAVFHVRSGAKLMAKVERLSSLVSRRTVALVLASAFATSSLSVLMLSSSASASTSYLTGCNASRNWVNPYGPVVSNDGNGGCSYTKLPTESFWATYAVNPVYAAGFWYSNASQSWVEGSVGFQYIGSSKSYNALLVSSCYPCSFSMHTETGSWVTSEY
jgi:hypothetical protein